MSSPMYYSEGTHAIVQGAWWWHHREVPALAFKGGTYCVTIGFVSDGTDIDQQWTRTYGAVMDDFGNLRIAGRLQ
jgi:hypothetical protein